MIISYFINVFFFIVILLIFITEIFDFPLNNNKTSHKIGKIPMKIE